MGIYCFEVDVYTTPEGLTEVVEGASFEVHFKATNKGTERSVQSLESIFKLYDEDGNEKHSDKKNISFILEPSTSWTINSFEDLSLSFNWHDGDAVAGDYLEYTFKSGCDEKTKRIYIVAPESPVVESITTISDGSSGNPITLKIKWSQHVKVIDESVFLLRQDDGMIRYPNSAEPTDNHLQDTTVIWQIDEGGADPVKPLEDGDRLQIIPDAVENLGGISNEDVWWEWDGTQWNEIIPPVVESIVTIDDGSVSNELVLDIVWSQPVKVEDLNKFELMGTSANFAETTNEFDFITTVSWDLDLDGSPLVDGDSLIIYGDAVINKADMPNDEESWDWDGTQWTTPPVVESIVTIEDGSNSNDPLAQVVLKIEWSQQVTVEELSAFRLAQYGDVTIVDYVIQDGNVSIAHWYVNGAGPLESGHTLYIDTGAVENTDGIENEQEIWDYGDIPGEWTN